MKISEETMNTIYTFILIILIANFCVTRAEYIERSKDTKDLINVVDKSTKAKEQNTIMLEKVEQEQQYTNKLLEIYIELNRK